MLMLSSFCYADSGFKPDIKLNISTNNSLTSVAKHYQTTFTSSNDSGGSQSGTGSGQDSSYSSLDTGYTLGVDFMHRISTIKNTEVRGVLSLSYSEAQMLWPNGLGIFTSPTTVYSTNYETTPSLELKWTANEQHVFTFRLGHKTLFIRDHIHMGHWRLKESGDINGTYMQFSYLYPVISTDAYQLSLRTTASYFSHTPSASVGVQFGFKP